MATKPNIVLARWADTLAANVVNPPSGSRDHGHVAGDPLDDGFMNALQLQAYRWFQYLSDGDLTGDHSIAGNLTVTGDSEVTGNSEVDGRLTVAGGIKHAYTRSYTIPAIMAGPDTLRDAAGNRFTIGTSTARIIYPVPIHYPTNGTITRITRWSLRIDNGSGSGTITARLYRYDATTGAEAGVGAAVTLTNSSFGKIAMAQSGLTEDSQISDRVSYYVAFTGGGTAGDFTYHLEYDLVDQ